MVSLPQFVAYMKVVKTVAQPVNSYISLPVGFQVLQVYFFDVVDNVILDFAHWFYCIIDIFAQ